MGSSAQLKEKLCSTLMAPSSGALLLKPSTNTLGSDLNSLKCGFQRRRKELLDLKYPAGSLSVRGNTLGVV